jgi:hypothetical protein
MRKSKRMVLGACALAMLMTTAVTAEEGAKGVPIGEAAPDFGAGGFINTEPLKLSELKGRLVLLELFSTT